MKRITVHLGKRSYDILIGRGLLRSLGRFVKPLGLGSKVLIVSNRRVARFFLPAVSRSLAGSGFRVYSYLLPHGDERDKSERELAKLWAQMAQIGLDRTSTVLALGGGVVGDVASFAASTYMRGIALVQVPTTLLAQVDSAIGGKTAIDLPRGKNLVGTFYQPRVVISDVEALKTLSLYEFQNQFAEVVKYGVIQDATLFKLLERKAEWFFSSVRRKYFGKQELAFLEHVVWRSASVKAKVVQQDELERTGKRMILNYGHTFAHALEGASGFRLPHGRAVSSGMILAGELACRLKLFSKAAQERQIRLIKQVGLPAKQRYSSARILSFMKRDKKNQNGKLRLILPRAIGRVEVNERISEKSIRTLLNEFRSS